jgi:hypothetical protein
MMAPASGSFDHPVEEIRPIGSRREIVVGLKKTFFRERAEQGMPEIFSVYEDASARFHYDPHKVERRGAQPLALSRPERTQPMSISAIRRSIMLGICAAKVKAAVTCLGNR